MISALAKVVAAFVAAMVVVVIIAVALVPTVRPVIVAFSSHLISNLVARLSSTVLSVWLEAVVPVNAQNAAINYDFVEHIDGKHGFFPCMILNETKPALLHRVPIQTHNQVL